MSRGTCVVSDEGSSPPVVREKSRRNLPQISKKLASFPSGLELNLNCSLCSSANLKICIAIFFDPLGQPIGLWNLHPSGILHWGAWAAIVVSAANYHHPKLPVSWLKAAITVFCSNISRYLHRLVSCICHPCNLSIHLNFKQFDVHLFNSLPISLFFEVHL